MKTDENWKETRVLSEDIEVLFGIPRRTTEEFLDFLEQLIVHKYLEAFSDSDENTDIALELPYLGTLVVTGKKGKTSVSFSPRKKFYQRLRRAQDGVSPLSESLSDLLGKDLVNKMEKGESLDGRDN